MRPPEAGVIFVKAPDPQIADGAALSPTSDRFKMHCLSLITALIFEPNEWLRRRLHCCPAVAV
jgi:hypothetical protein